MNRKIKFRAWTGEQMVSPDYITRDGIAHWKENSIPTSTDKVMQFTGLYDKHGVEIYEGDVCQSHFSEKVKYLIEYYVDGFKLKNLFKIKRYNFKGILQVERTPHKANYSDWGKMEIIGNIYENPELLS